MHILPSDIITRIPERFTDPFRYSPHPSVRTAAGLLMQRIKDSEELSAIFAEGKMLGVLIVSDRSGQTGFLSAFSGNVAGRSHLDGFVPPIYDLLDPAGHFKIREAEITALNTTIESYENGHILSSLRNDLAEALMKREEEIGLVKASMAISRREREEIRQEVTTPSCLAELARQSQFEKAELRRLKQGWKERIDALRADLNTIEDSIREMKLRRSDMSDKLQKWIFSSYIVHNTLGEEKSIGDIFADVGLTPPGGTGECAAPKLLEYAWRNGLKPLAMGEFWYGLSPETAVRTEGHFYPSCTSKCGPLLNFMLKGLDLTEDPYTVCGQPEIIFEDQHIIVVSKPSGMPSVPGLDGKTSLSEWLTERYGTEIFPVHRLDQDTSGIMVYAGNRESSIVLQRQFEQHSISKIYKARLSAVPEGRKLMTGDKGWIRLPLNADYDERPRQKADVHQGKDAATAYEVTDARTDGTTDILFFPHTGRTHQLRVHSAHTLGLGHPIAGDLLYGGSPASRLNLHAFSISFDHPATGERVTFSTSTNGYEE